MRSRFERDAAIAYVKGRDAVSALQGLCSFLLRILGVWLLLLAMVAAVIDATKSLAGQAALGCSRLWVQQWSSLNPDSLAAAKT